MAAAAADELISSVLVDDEVFDSIDVFGVDLMGRERASQTSQEIGRETCSSVPPS